MAHRLNIFHRSVCLVALSLCLMASACKGNNAGDAASKDGAKATAGATEPVATNGKAEEVAEQYPDNVYQDFNFSQFDQRERAKFVRVAKAELCPCPDAKTSMHECLKTRETRCGIAEEAASMMGAMVKADYSETDILDKVAELIENASKVWTFELKDRPFKGKVDAPVTIIEFADFQCPHCKEASKIMKELHEKYPEKLVVYYKHYPLASHPFAAVASRAAVAAERQGKFWPMHDLLFQHQLSLDAKKVLGFARQIGLNMKKFEADMENPEVAAIVAKDKSEGDETGLTGTPTIFINGKRYLGEVSKDSIEAAMKSALAEAEAKTNTNN